MRYRRRLKRFRSAAARCIGTALHFASISTRSPPRFRAASVARFAFGHRASRATLTCSTRMANIGGDQSRPARASKSRVRRPTYPGRARGISTAIAVMRRSKRVSAIGSGRARRPAMVPSCSMTVRDVTEQPLVSGFGSTTQGMRNRSLCRLYRFCRPRDGGCRDVCVATGRHGSSRHSPMRRSTRARPSPLAWMARTSSASTRRYRSIASHCRSCRRCCRSVFRADAVGLATYLSP